MKRWIIVTAVAASMLAACGGGDKQPDSAVRGDAGGTSTESERLVSAQAVLSRAAERTQEVDTVRGEFSMRMSSGGTSITFDGTMAFRAPGSMYMAMDIFGNEMEIIAELPDMYINMPGEGWKKISFDDLGIDYQQFRDYMENRGVIDLEQMSEAMADAEQLPDDTIDGTTYQHYRGTLDVSKLSENLPQGAFDPELLGQVEEVLKSATYEFWIDEENSLPRRYIMDMEMDLPEPGPMDFSMTMDFLDYNGDVDIPAPPADAAPLELP